MGTKGDSYDNALAEAFNALYKSELIYKRGPWQGLEDVEHGTLDYVHWFNEERIHRELHDLTPAEVEEAYYHQQPPSEEGGTQNVQ